MSNLSPKISFLLMLAILSYNLEKSLAADESVPGGPDARNSSETVAKGTHHLSPLQGRLLTAEDKEAAFVVTVTANYTTSEPKIVYAGCLLSERTVLTFYNSLIAPPNDPYIKIDGAVVTAGVQASAAPEDKQVRFVPSSNITAFPGRKPSSYDINTSLKNAMTLLQVAEPFILGTATQFIRVATDRGPSLAAISASDLMVFGFPRIVPGSPAKFDGTVLGMECPLTSPGFFYGADLDTNATSCVVISPRTGSTCNPLKAGSAIVVRGPAGNPYLVGLIGAADACKDGSSLHLAASMVYSEHQAQICNGSAGAVCGVSIEVTTTINTTTTIASTTSTSTMPPSSAVITGKTTLAGNFQNTSIISTNTIMKKETSSHSTTAPLQDAAGPQSPPSENKFTRLFSIIQRLCARLGK